MRAVKNNKEYCIGENQKKVYQDAGFDIYNDEGEIVAFAQGKMVPYELYAAKKAEVEKLQKENDELRTEMDEMLAIEGMFSQGGEERQEQESELSGEAPEKTAEKSKAERNKPKR